MCDTDCTTVLHMKGKHFMQILYSTIENISCSLAAIGHLQPSQDCYCNTRSVHEQQVVCLCHYSAAIICLGSGTQRTVLNCVHEHMHVTWKACIWQPSCCAMANLHRGPAATVSLPYGVASCIHACYMEGLHGRDALGSLAGVQW